jgi:hypothetical protein
MSTNLANSQLTDEQFFGQTLEMLVTGQLHDDLSPRSRGVWDWQREDQPIDAAERKRQYERAMYAKKNPGARNYDKTAALLKLARNPCPPMQDSDADKARRARLTGKQAPMGIDL